MCLWEPSVGSHMKSHIFGFFSFTNEISGQWTVVLFSCARATKGTEERKKKEQRAEERKRR